LLKDQGDCIELSQSKKILFILSQWTRSNTWLLLKFLVFLCTVVLNVIIMLILFCQYVLNKSICFIICQSLIVSGYSMHFQPRVDCYRWTQRTN